MLYSQHILVPTQFIDFDIEMKFYADVNDLCLDVSDK